jgi:hypothetical protein
VSRRGTQSAGGTPGACGGVLTLDFDAWMATSPQERAAARRDGLQAGLFRDPQSTSNQTTSLSDSLRFGGCA